MRKEAIERLEEMRKMEVRAAIERLEELKETIYETLDEIKDILREVAPEELQRAEVYCLAHIDGALEDRYQWLGESLIKYPLKAQPPGHTKKKKKRR